MNQTYSTTNQQPDLIPSDKISESTEEDYFDNDEEDVDDQDDFSEDDYYDNDNDDDYDEEQERLRAFYNIKTKLKPVFSPEKQEELKERQQKLQEKKREKQEEEQQHPPEQHIFDIKDEVPDEKMIFNKGKKLVHSTTGVKGFCYVPQKSLIFIVTEDSKNVLVYSSGSFKMAKRLKFMRPVKLARYLEEYDKVFFGGDDFLVQTFNLCTFRLGRQTDVFSSEHISEIASLQKKRIGVATIMKELYIMSTSLRTLYTFRSYCANPITDIISLTSNIILTSSTGFDNKSLFLCNFKTGETQSCNISVLPSSCIELTKKGPLKTVTCLAKLPGIWNQSNVPIAELALDTKNCKLFIHRTGPKDKVFNTLEKIQNNNYFVAYQYVEQTSRMVLLKVYDDGLQIIKTVTQYNCNILSPNMSIWLNQRSLLLSTTQQGSVFVCHVAHKKQSNKELEN